MGPGESQEPGGAPLAEGDRDVFGRVPSKHRDWSHRRREPRGLALYWTVYLMLATMMSLMPMVMTGQFSGNVYRPAARSMVLLVVIGVCLLWPVLRASQDPQRERAFGDVARDWSVLVIPGLVLLWPQVILARWPVSVVAALTCVLLIWTIVSGSALMWWHRFSGGRLRSRILLVSVCAALLGGVPLAMLASGALGLGRPGPDATAGWMWSPLTAAWEVLRSRDWSGAAAAVSGTHWEALRAQAVMAFALMVVSAVSCRAGLDGGRRSGYARS